MLTQPKIRDDTDGKKKKEGDDDDDDDDGDEEDDDKGDKDDKKESKLCNSILNGLLILLFQKRRKMTVEAVKGMVVMKMTMMNGWIYLMEAATHQLQAGRSNLQMGPRITKKGV